MSALEAYCPACGGPVAFKRGASIVVICDYCHSAIARGDRTLQDLGKVAEVVETGSPLAVDLAGVYRGVPFQLTGRAQLGHQAGGVWDEWYAAFADGTWGWLAEAQGRFYMTFQQELPEQTLIPPFELLELGQAVHVAPGSAPLIVAEKGEAEARGAEGEIPYLLRPGAAHRYADLSGPGGEFATIDYSGSGPLLFAGTQIAFEDLGFPETARPPEREPARVSALQLSCPKCAGPLALRAPDQTERVTCPNCGSLLDVSQGRLEYLKALRPSKVVPKIPIGAVGEFDGARLTVIGFMQRSVQFDKRYYWEEYLLYEPSVGFRWLVCSDDNWNFVQPVEAGDVINQSNSVRFAGNRFKLYQDATARVEHVLGEFFWRVTEGEEALTADYIHPPFLLSKEVSQMPDGDNSTEDRRRTRRRSKTTSGEINWSLGKFVKARDIEKTFGISGLPRTSKIAPNQPFPHKSIYKYWLLLLGVALVLAVFFMVTGSRRPVFEQSYRLEPLARADATSIIFSEPFGLQARQNVKMWARANVDNSWLYIEGDLVDEATGLVQAFSMPVEYYHGVDGGESWREGSQTSSTHLSAMPPGQYTLRLEVSWERWQQPAALSVRVEQGVPRVLHMVLTIVALSLIPILVMIYHISFERRRWEDSDYSPYHNE